MAELPPHPEPLCFSEYIREFQDKEFQVDEFIGKCRKKVTIECLRQDLDSYYRTLKSAMVELINKDYADFVNLSSNLVGMDKSIGDLMTPLGQLQEEIRNIKVSMETAIRATDDKLAQRDQIRKDKDTLRRILFILESTEKLERLLKIKHSSQESQQDEQDSEIERLASKSEFAPMVMERVAREFNKLQYNARLTNHVVVEENTPRIHVITSTLQSKLEESFQSGLAAKDRGVLTQCLQTYASIGRCSAAEDLFRMLVVRPYMDKVISAKALITRAGGLSGLFGDILQFIPESCSLVLELTHTPPGSAPRETADIVKGFDFLVNSVWPEVVAVIEKKLSVIFAPGNPDTFHKNYSCSMEFVASFEGHCHSLSSIKSLRSHPSYSAFMTKWSLPVYFQIRFQDIAGTLESSLTLPLLPTSLESHESKPHPSGSGPHPSYKLEVFTVLEQCIVRCWSDDIFIPALVHRFWKLTLQLLVRVSVWLGELSMLPIQKVGDKKAQGQGSSAITDALAANLKVIHDIELLHSKVKTLFQDHIEAKTKSKEHLQETMYETSFHIQKLVPNFASLIVTGLAQLCMQSLECANTLPRLFRRTNKETPTKPSTYVLATLRPLQHMIGDFPTPYRVEWTERVVSTLSKRYFEIGSELLTSVQRTEESLLKLKSYRKSLTPSATGGGGGMTDDNKIRLQLALDIEQFTLQVLTVHPSAMNISEFKQLLEIGQLAKATSS